METTANKGNYSYADENWNTHLIEPEKKTSEWGRDVFLSSRANMRPLFGGWYAGTNNYDAMLIRQFAEGNQPIERYKAIFDPQDKEGLYMGINWDIAPIIPSIRQRVLAELNKIPANVQCNADDPIANNQRNMDKLRLKAQVVLDEQLAYFSKKMGLQRPIKSEFDKKILRNPSGGEGMPNVQLNFENDDELQILMNSEYYSLDVEVAQEITQKVIFDFNQFDEMSKLLKEDAVDYGTCAHRLYIDNYTGMPRFQYMRPYGIYITSSKYKDYHDAMMWYHKPPATLSDVLEQIGNELTEEGAREIWEHSVKRRANDYPSYNLYGWDWRRWNNADLKKIEVDMYYFEFKSPDVVTYEESKTKNGRKQLRKKKYDYKEPEDSKYEKKKINYWAECVYKGYFIEGMTKVYQWGKLLNMPREQGREQFTPFSLMIYKFSEKGLTENVISYADMHQEAYLRMKYAIIKALPRGYSFNWDALAEVDYGTGGKLSKEDLIKMYVQTGSTIHRTLNENGDMLPMTANGAPPHMLMENGLDPSVEWFLNIMNSMADKIALTYGINPTADAVAPNPKTLVGVSQMAAVASSNARHFLYSGVQQIIIKSANYLNLMLNDIIKYNPETWEKIKAMVGRVNEAVLETIDDMPLYHYGFFFEDEPTDGEMAQLQADIGLAFQQGRIDMSDYLMIKFMKNRKQAIQMLNLKAKKREAKAAQSAEQQMELESKRVQMELMAKIALEKQAGQNSKETAEITGKYNLIIKQLDAQTTINKQILQQVGKLNLSREEQAHEKSMNDAAAI